VTADEGRDIAGSGVFRDGPNGSGIKYFTTSRAAAKNYATMAERQFGHIDGKYSIVKAVVPNSILRGISATLVDGGIPAYVIPIGNLDGISPALLAEEEGDVP
jgi:hypothetical protein